MFEECLKCEVLIHRQERADCACKKYAKIMEDIVGEDILVESRVRIVVWGRNIVMHQMQKDGFGVSEIARSMSRKHSTVLHALHNVDQMFRMPRFYEVELELYKKFQEKLTKK